MPSPFRGFPHWLCAVACIVPLTLSASAEAQQASAADKAAAEQLFDTALSLMREGRTAEACPKLEQSQRIDPGIGTLLYLAECYEKLGRTASAWATFREALSAAQTAKQFERARMAEERSQRLQPLLTKLTIEVPEENQKLPEFVVKRSGQVVTNTMWGLPIPVDPGVIQVEATAKGYTTFITTIEVKQPGASENIKIPILQPLPHTSAASAPPSEGEDEQTVGAAIGTTPSPIMDSPTKESLNTQRVIAIGLGGVGVIGLGIGSYFGIRAISKNSDAEQYCPSGNTCTDQKGVTLTEEASDAAVVSNIAFGVGAVALISGAYLFLTGAPEKRSGIRVAPLVSHNGGVITATGAFE